MKLSGIASRRVIILDTGPLVAAIDAGDAHHRWAKTILPKLTGDIFTCEAVIAEAPHLLNNQPQAVDALEQFVARMQLVTVLRDESEAIFAQMKRFAPQMDLADACLVTLAARHADAIVLTTDTRDFSIYRVPFASPEGLFAEF
jgi:predicted nucleic acid-binding protein